MIYEILLATLFLVWIIDCILCFIMGVFYADRDEVPAVAFLVVFSSIILTVVVNYMMR